MKRVKLFIALLTLSAISQFSFGQGQSQKFKMEGTAPETIEVNQTFTSTTEITPFNNNVNKVFGLAISAEIMLDDKTGEVKIILVDKNHEEYLVWESNYLLADKIGEPFTIEEICEETAALNDVKVKSLRIEVVNAKVEFKNITYTRAIRQGINFDLVNKEKKREQNLVKIDRINKKLQEKGINWVAGATGISELSYAEKKQLYGQSKFPAGFEYYSGGVFSTSASAEQLKSATASMYVDEWDWRYRHGKNWITPITDQGACGSCWAFAATGATEAMVNVYFNQILNLDLSEQEILSCSGGGTCGGGYPSTALDFIKNTGIVDEATFVYNGTDQPCENKSSSSGELIKISGRLNYGYSEFPKEEDILKKMLINYGPLSGGLLDWSHAMVLVGYKIVKEGDIFYYRDLSLSRSWKTVVAGDPLIGKTVWIFKNSWGVDFGDEGFVYVETPISNMSWTHAIKTPVISAVNNYQVVCEDADGDGYYWWGLGPKPATCTGPDTPDGNDADPTLGPLDEYGYCTVISGAPVVSISADKTSVNKGQIVNFTDLSTNEPTSWAWSFQGGNPSISNAKSPAVTYSISGSYDVTLNVTNAKGTSSKTFTKYITVAEPVVAPVVNFTSDVKTVQEGGTVTFSDLSTNNPTTWNWTFNGGNPATSTAQNPKVVYPTPGAYSVSLTVGNAAGTVTKTVADYISVNEKIPVYCTSGGTASDEWIASVQLGTQVFNSSSSGTVGYKDQTGNIFKADAGSIQNIVLSPGFSGPGKREYWNIWIDYNGDKDFDDANELVFSSSASSKDVKGSFTIPSELNITTRMRVSMKRNSAASQCEVFSLGEVKDYTISIITPAPLPPLAEFTAVKTKVLVGESVQFNDLSQNEPSQWEWSFPGGNPSTSNLRNPVVTYSVAGQYDVSLKVSKPGFDPIIKLKQKYIESTENVISDYCIPVGINSSTDYIQSVTVGNVLNNVSGGNGYSLIQGPANMFAGWSYDVTLTPAVSSNRNYWRLWIDFNADGDFEDAGETLVSMNNKKGTFNANIAIPSGATGKTRMRIAMRNAAAPNSCDVNYAGEVEDYEVAFEPAASMASSVMTGNSEMEVSPGYKIFPNPANHYINIALESVMPGDFYTLYNMNGEQMISRSVSNSFTKVDLENYATGIYVLVLVNGDKVYNEKVIKK